MEKKSFINSIKEGALKGHRDYGILPSLTIAQAILESGWGGSQLTQKANNLFGIKAFSNWKGKRITLPTTEWYNGQKQIVNADFRAYNTLNESIEDHNNLLTAARYKSVRGCREYNEACLEIYKCGYATDPAYPSKLIKIIEDNRLYEFDGGNSNQEAAVDKESKKVKKFQHLCNTIGIRDHEGKSLVEDNILGPRTKSCIGKLPVLKKGSRGFAVGFVQEEIGGMAADGIFGPITERKIAEYQRSKGIMVDGIIGVETWTSILSV